VLIRSAPVSRRKLVTIALASLLATAGATAFWANRRGAFAPPLPTVTIGGATQPEGCLLCHASEKAPRGIGEAHAKLGCSPCHLGDPRARDEADAHRGLEVLAGELAIVDRTCGQGACHAVETARVRTSLMARAPGILAVDRFAFGERATPAGEDADDLSLLAPERPPASPAESHARQLCASCHLGAKKERRGDLGMAARGGGCTACHLGAPTPSSFEAREGPLHPAVTAAVSDRRCEGCHARSGRIALSYRGVVELEQNDPRVTGRLPDGRPAGTANPDVHAKAGLGCVDCHTERELMGDGARHRHAHEARDVTCEDCHVAGKGVGPATRDEDREAVADRLRASWSRRELPPLSKTPLRTAAGTPLVRTDAATRSMWLLATGERRAIPRAKSEAYHALPGHARLDCQACHAQWAPRCTQCHTRFDAAGEAIDHLSGKTVRGRWIEEAGGNGFGPPLLAIGPTGRIEPFVEGMTLRIEPGNGAAASTIDRTLWAPLDPHTTGKSRTCVDCHAPQRPEDVYPSRGETTRVSARLLDAGERARLLAVGPCLGCHAHAEDAIYRDFAASRARLIGRTAPRCLGRGG
jgi:hypothetical protein